MECFYEFETWLDWNGNGIRDPEDGPLEGVVFHLKWYYYFDGSGIMVDTLTSNSLGHAWGQAHGCGCGGALKEVEAPPGYSLTTDDPTSFGFAPP
jgi:hypothetical protein